MAKVSTDNTLYAHTINGQITRINNATNLLATKATDWGLKVPATTDSIPTTVATGTENVVATSHIEDVAAAINLIDKKTFTDNKTTANLSFNGKTASGSYTIVNGYYPNDVVVNFTEDMANAVFNTSIYNESTNAKGVKMATESTATVQNTTPGYANSNLTVSLPAGDYTKTASTTSTDTGVKMASASTATITRSTTGYAPSSITVTLPGGNYGTSAGTMTAEDKVKISRTTEGYAPDDVTATIPAGAYNTATTASGSVAGVSVNASGQVVISRKTQGYAPSTITAALPVEYKTTAPDLTIDVLVDNTTNDTIVKSGFIPAGYYPSDTNVNVIVKEGNTDIKQINVQSTKAATQSNHSAITPDTGYDYLKKVTVADAGTFGITDTTSTLTVGAYDGTNKYYPVTQANGLVGTVATAGWTGTTVGTDSSVKVGTIAKATITASATGGSKEIAAPALTKYTTDGTNGGHPALLTSDAISTTEPTSGFWVAMKSNADATGQTISVTPKYTVTDSGYITKDSTANGTAVDAKVTLAEGVAHYVKLKEAAVSGSGSKEATAPTIQQGAASTTNTNRISSTPSTTVPTSGYYVAVQATAPATTGIAFTQTSATEGYVKLAAGASLGTASTTEKTGSVYYAPIDAGTHTIGKLSINPASDATGYDSHVGAGNYYVKCDTTTGYQLASSTYIDLGKSTLTASGITYDSVNNKFIASAVTSAGYTEGETNTISDFSVTVGSGATLTTNSDSKSITANTYYPSAATVNVSSTTAEIKGKSGSNTGVSTATALGNLTANTTFTNSDKKFFSSFTVDVTDIIADLKSI